MASRQDRRTTIAIKRTGTVVATPKMNAGRLNISRSMSGGDYARHSMGTVTSPTLDQSDKEIKRQEKLQKKRQKFLNMVL